MIVRAAEPSEMDSVVKVLSEAFEDDPVNEWVFPGDGRRAVVNPIFFRWIVGEVFATGGRVDVAGDLSGVIVWTHSATEEQIQQPDPFPGLFDAEVERLGALFELMAQRSPDGEYHHAQFIGVAKGRQGQGIGGRMLRHGLDRCRADGLSAYLEASSPASAKLYRRLGFRDLGEAFVIGDGGPPMQPMWCDPE